MKLPTINGFETYVAIRRINPEVVTIMMTARPPKMADLIGEVLTNHACACLFEPVDMTEVLKSAGGILERKQREREGRHG